jgi:hypothetical protein
LIEVKKKGIRHREELACGVVHLDDLDAIVEVMRELGCSYEESVREPGMIGDVSPVVEIETSTHEFESVEELGRCGQPTIGELSLHLSTPRLMVELKPWQLVVYAPGFDALAVAGCVERIRWLAQQTKPGLRGFLVRHQWSATFTVPSLIPLAFLIGKDLPGGAGCRDPFRSTRVPLVALHLLDQAPAVHLPHQARRPAVLVGAQQRQGNRHHCVERDHGYDHGAGHLALDQTIGSCLSSNGRTPFT